MVSWRPSSWTRMLVVTAIAVVLVPTATASAQADGCDDRPGLIRWDASAGTTDWNEPTNWEADALPGPGAHVCIDLASGVTFASGSAILASLQVADGSSLAITGATA